MKKLIVLFVALFATLYLSAEKVITYTAAEKLLECRYNNGSWSGYLSTSAFDVRITSHIFSDGVGTITFSGDVKKIGRYAFSGCTGLTSITIPDGVTSIGSFAFQGCTGLTSITIPNSVTSISMFAFDMVFNVVYHGNAKGSPWGARSLNGYVDGYFVYEDATKTTLLGCSAAAMGEIIIPNSVTSVGGVAFIGCTNLTSITIPNSVASIEWYAFSDVFNVIYTGNATGSPWGARSVNGYVDGHFVYKDATKTTLLGCSAAATGEITIPNSVTSIGNGAFYSCTSLTSITIPNSVTSIGEYAFSNCKGLTSITILNSVTSIKSETFCDCKMLTSITIPNGVTSIGSSAFYGCTSLTSVTIPNSVTSIGENAFYGCKGLTSITIPNSVTSIGENAFYLVFNVVYHGNAKGSRWGARSVNGYVDGHFVYKDAAKTTLLT